MSKLKVTESYSVDEAMWNTTFTLLRDFQNSGYFEPGEHSALLLALKRRDIGFVRNYSLDLNDDLDEAAYKAIYQLQSILKRYRFENDLYSDAELIEKAVSGYTDTQHRLQQVNLDSLGLDCHRVLDLAALYIRQTLGAYDDGEHRRLCRFGRKASIGVPARLACEAARWELPITGSQNQITWFRQEIDEIEQVQEYFALQISRDPSKGSLYQEVDSLRLTLVPKTFKSFRSIMPNTTIGSYMSFGLGVMIQKRLQRRGYDIRTLQHVHRVLARKASLDGSLVTADLSSASDSITVQLVERLFPADWVKILNQSRIGTVDLPNGQTVESMTYCTMGIGYTFPLQTLVFLSLLKAIQATMKYRPGVKRRISVYGDDMIYPTGMHSLVLSYFQQFGFVINIDKTFHEGNFRESCGGDYYRGTDVRPFQPRNGAAIVRQKKAYEAALYKLINGLLKRWTEHDLRNTLDYLVSEIVSLGTSVKVVPGDFSDDAGVKCAWIGCFEFLSPDLCNKPVHIGHGLFRFAYLGLVSEERKEVRHEPYYWLSLRSPPSHRDYSGDEQGLPSHPNSVLGRINQATGVMENTCPLITRQDVPEVTFRSKISKRRLRRSSTYVTVSHTGRYTRQSGTSCFGVRR